MISLIKNSLRNNIGHLKIKYRNFLLLFNFACSFFSRETFVDNEGQERRGQSGADDGYNYQAAFNWGVQIIDAKKIVSLLKKEQEDPTVYDLTPEAAVIQEPIYRKAYRLPRRRKR